MPGCQWKRSIRREITDYIYAEDKRIAQAAFNYQHDIQTYGTNCSKCTVGYAYAWIAPADPLTIGYTIRLGDTIYVQQGEDQRGTGIMVAWSGGNSAWSLRDGEGQYLNDWQDISTGSLRTANLSSLAGKIITGVATTSESDVPTGSWQSFYNQIEIISIDGTVHPIFDGQPSVSASMWGTSTATNRYTGMRCCTGTGQGVNPTLTTKYYLSDHLGSSRGFMSAFGSFPLSMDEYAPFGQEIANNADENHYKFTGKERDTESGLDHFQFRSYASTMGRWMSPDPAGMMAADIEYPQTLNRYAYVNNNPLSFIDPLGLDCAYLNNSGSGVESFDQHSSSGERGKTGGYWVDGGLTDAKINADKGTVQFTGTNNKTDQTHASYQDTSVYVGMYQNT